METLSTKEQLKILIVDDEEDMCETLSMILRDEGYNVVSANDADKAITKVREGRIGAIFMDIVLPDMNGVEAYKVIKKINPEIAVVMMTGYLDKDFLVAQAFKERVYCCLYKPFRMQEFLKVVKKIMRGEKK